MTEETAPQNDLQLKELCDQASHEQDPEKLLSLTKQICEILDQKRNAHLQNISKKSA
jgi:hypothetical protein